MFEKDVLQLIRGLRAHKGQEREYIQSSLRECRREIKSNDMDQKATALMKLVYLEMFGHDMGWASFNVLEVMSSQKYLQKRVGYLAAVQSFRPDTEVLMLAENLLKKDLTGSDKLLINLPLNAIPHLVNSSMANSLLADLLPRLSHSQPAIRKKTIVTLYRLAVVYPETLRPAWPKIKERLLDNNEDPSVTAAIVNVVCELGWRRPQDFLPLAPRLFELLTQGGNNWMAIKIIKLFSQLTPLEPRLVKKLLPPLTSIIKTTPAMSLLYECINGIIQGGIMEAAGGTTEGDEVARLCVSKLRAMLVVQGDPNLRYVALLAFAKITASHADLVADHQDVILECIDDPDISIRTRALDLVVGMVNSNNLPTVVDRLLKQLKTAGRPPVADEPENDRAFHEGVIPMADDEDESTAMSIPKKDQRSDEPPPLPEDYRISVIERILEMCSKGSYANMDDFEWYIGVLIDLVGQCPPGKAHGSFGSQGLQRTNMADAIGDELRNVAVRVKGVRPEAAVAAQSLLLVENRDRLFPAHASSAAGVLAAAAFVAGEYSDLLPDPDATLTSLLHSTSTSLPPVALTSYLQAAPKVFATLTSSPGARWTSVQQSQTALLTARLLHFLEPLTHHPSLEIQERAVEYLDLMRLASEAAAAHSPSESSDPPLLLTQAIPALFSGAPLNPVAPAALRKVVPPTTLDLDTPLNPSLPSILASADYDYDADTLGSGAAASEVHRFYYEKPASSSFTSAKSPTVAADLLSPAENSRSSSYQDSAAILDPEAAERKRAERRERYKDDPYYIDSSGASTPVHNILRGANGGELDVDSIPVMELKLEGSGSDSAARSSRPTREKKAPRREKKMFEITGDETIEGDDLAADNDAHNAVARPKALGRGKKSVLQVDSSGLSSLSLSVDENGLNSSSANSGLDYERRVREEEEMAKAMKEVERLRLEMQRREEGVREGEGEVVVKRKGGRKVRRAIGGGDDVEGEAVEGKEKKKRKKKKRGDGTEAAEPAKEKVAEDQPVKAKRRKKRQVTFDEPG